MRFQQLKSASACLIAGITVTTLLGQAPPPAPAPIPAPPAAAPAAPPSPAPAPAAPVEKPKAPDTPPIIKIDGKLKLNFADAPVDTVLGYLSEVAGLVVIRDEEVKGRITVISKQAMPLDEALQVINSVLKEKGYTAVRTGKTLKVISLSNAKKSNVPVRIGTDPELVPETDEILTQVMPLKHVDAVRLKTDLASLLSDNADLASNQASNSLIMTDVAVNIRRFCQIISAMDTATAEVVDVKVFPLKYASSTETAKLLNDIFKETNSRKSGGGSNPMTAYLQARASGQDSRDAARNAMGGGKSKGETPLIASADTRTNTVVVSASPDALITVAHIVAQLDANPSSEQSVLVYQVKNGTASKMQTVLSTLFQTSTTQGGRTGTRSGSSSNSTAGVNRERGGRGDTYTGGGGAPSGGSPFGGGSPFPGGSPFGGSPFGGGPPGFPGGGPPGSSGDPRSGFLDALRRGLSPESAQNAAELVGQVYVVADEDTNTLLMMANPKHFDIIKKILADLDRAIPQVLIKVLIAEVTHNDDLDIGTEFSILNLGPGGSNLSTTFDSALGLTGGGLVYKLITDEVTANIHALEKEGKLEVLSRPYILASENQAATINVGQEVPFVRNTRTDSLGQIINTIQYDDIGIILNVTPHINPDGIVVMDISQEVSAIGNKTVNISEGVPAPVIEKRSAKTRVSIKNSQTIVIGGLIEDSRNTTDSKIPILGDIPILNLLFSRQERSRTKKELLIFLTPHVAKMPEMLQPMSDDEKAGMKLVPDAIAPGVTEEYFRGMQRGATPKDFEVPAAPDAPSGPKQIKVPALTPNSPKPPETPAPQQPAQPAPIPPPASDPPPGPSGLGSSDGLKAPYNRANDEP